MLLIWWKSKSPLWTGIELYQWVMCYNMHGKEGKENAKQQKQMPPGDQRSTKNGFLRVLGNNATNASASKADIHSALSTSAFGFLYSTVLGSTGLEDQ